MYVCRYVCIHTCLCVCVCVCVCVCSRPRARVCIPVVAVVPTRSSPCRAPEKKTVGVWAVRVWLFPASHINMIRNLTK